MTGQAANFLLRRSGDKKDSTRSIAYKNLRSPLLHYQNRKEVHACRSNLLATCLSIDKCSSTATYVSVSFALAFAFWYRSLSQRDAGLGLPPSLSLPLLLLPLFLLRVSYFEGVVN